MDTSIAFALIAAALFVFIVPAILRRGVESRDDEQSAVRTRTVEVPQLPRCAPDRSRPVLVADSAHPAAVDLPPAPAAYVRTVPSVSLRREAPALEVVDAPAPRPDSASATGEGRNAFPSVGAAVAGPAGRSRSGEEPSAEALPLPMAAGETTMLIAQTGGGPEHHAHAPQQPAVSSVPSPRTPPLTVVDSTNSRPMEPAMNPTPRTAPRRIAAAAERMPRALPADVRARLDHAYTSAASRPRPGSPGSARGQQEVPPRPGSQPDVSAADRKRIRNLRRVLPYCGLAFVGLILATLVVTGFMVTGSVPWGVPAVTMALAIACLFLVRSLNREIAALRHGIEVSDGQFAERARSAADRARGVAERAAHQVTARTAGAGPRKRPREVVDLDADPVTDEIPVVRATTEAQEAPADEAPEAAGSAAGHATEDVSGAVAEDVTADAGAESARHARSRARSIVARSQSAPSLSWGFDAEDDDAGAPGLAAGSVDGSDGVGSAVPDPVPGRSVSEEETDQPSAGTVSAGGKRSTAAEALARRLGVEGWTPARMPAPTYVDAPVATRETPEPVVADASSYALAPTSRESLAEQFADELGYRPALEDAAREDEALSGRSAAAQTGTGDVPAASGGGPLDHGRNAIRSRTAGGSRPAQEQEPGPSQLGDILARRRA